MVARVTTGRGWPDARGTQIPVGGCVLLNAEDDADDAIKARLIAAEADVSRVNILDGVAWTDSEDESGERLFDLSIDVDVLDAAIDATPNCRLAIIDPITAFLGGVDDNRNAAVRGLLHPLKELASKHGVAIIGITHLTKGTGPATSRVMGSTGFTAAPRSAWTVVKDPEDPTKRLFLPIKANYSAGVSGLAYYIATTHVEGYGTTPLIHWCDGAVEITADVAMQEPEKRTEIDGVVEWLRDFLRAGRKPSLEVFDVGKNEHGYSERTIWRANKRLAVKVGKGGMKDGWTWRLPEGCPDTDRWQPSDNRGNLLSSSSSNGSLGRRRSNPEDCEGCHPICGPKPGEIWTPTPGEPVEERTG